MVVGRWCRKIRGCYDGRGCVVDGAEEEMAGSGREVFDASLEKQVNMMIT